MRGPFDWRGPEVEALGLGHIFGALLLFFAGFSAAFLHGARCADDPCSPPGPIYASTSNGNDCIGAAMLAFLEYFF